MIQEIIKLKEQGFKSTEISKHLNIPHSTFHKYCSKNGINFSLNSSRLSLDKKKEIERLYLEGYSCRQISSILNTTSLKTISHYLKEKGLFKEKKKNIAVEIDLTQNQKEIFYGCLLGDSSMELNSNKTKARFKFGHSLKQKDYLLYKQDLFKGIVSDLYERESYHKKVDKSYKGCCVNSFYLKSLKEIYDLFYVNGRKSITEENVKLLTIQSFAYLFMDDGTKKGVISTMSFTKEENEILVNHLKNISDVEFKVILYFEKRNNKTYYLIRPVKKELLKFNNLIKEYIPESMKYKLIIQ